jgi:hypothetical protein
MVHAAIHDAVQAYEKRFHPYAVDIDHTTGSPVARAARDVLVNRFPAPVPPNRPRSATSIRATSF